MSMVAGAILILICYAVIGLVGCGFCNNYKWDDERIVIVFWPLIFIKWLLTNMFKAIVTGKQIGRAHV